MDSIQNADSVCNKPADVLGTETATSGVTKTVELDLAEFEVDSTSNFDEIPLENKVAIEEFLAEASESISNDHQTQNDNESSNPKVIVEVLPDSYSDFIEAFPKTEPSNSPSGLLVEISTKSAKRGRKRKTAELDTLVESQDLSKNDSVSTSNEIEGSSPLKRSLRKKTKTRLYQELSDDETAINEYLSNNQSGYYSDDDYKPSGDEYKPSGDEYVPEEKIPGSSDSQAGASKNQGNPLLKKRRRRKNDLTSDQSTSKGKRGRPRKNTNTENNPTKSTEEDYNNSSNTKLTASFKTNEITQNGENSVVLDSDSDSGESKSNLITNLMPTGEKEFEKFLSTRVSDQLKIKKISKTLTEPLEIPSISLPEAKQIKENSSQTVSPILTSSSVQTGGPFAIKVKQNKALNSQQNDSACEFLTSTLSSTIELGKLITDKSQEFLHKKVNTSNITDVTKIDYCIQKSLLLFKLAKDNLTTMEETLEKRYEEFLSENKLLDVMELDKKVIPKCIEPNSDSDCEIVEVTKPTKPVVKKFNPKTVFLNKELSIKIAKPPVPKITASPNKQPVNVTGKQTVWINNSVKIKKVTSNQSFLALDSRLKKPPDSFVTVAAVKNFFDSYYSKSICSRYTSIEWLNGNSLVECACNYFYVLPPNSDESSSENTEVVDGPANLNLLPTEINERYDVVGPPMMNGEIGTQESHSTEPSLCQPEKLSAIALESLQKHTTKKCNHSAENGLSSQVETISSLITLSTIKVIECINSVLNRTNNLVLKTPISLKDFCAKSVIDIITLSSKLEGASQLFRHPKIVSGCSNFERTFNDKESHPTSEHKSLSIKNQYETISSTINNLAQNHEVPELRTLVISQLNKIFEQKFPSDTLNGQIYHRKENINFEVGDTISYISKLQTYKVPELRTLALDLLNKINKQKFLSDRVNGYRHTSNLELPTNGFQNRVEFNAKTLLKLSLVVLNSAISHQECEVKPLISMCLEVINCNISLSHAQGIYGNQECGSDYDCESDFAADADLQLEFDFEDTEEPVHDNPSSNWDMQIKLTEFRSCVTPINDTEVVVATVKSEPVEASVEEPVMIKSECLVESHDYFDSAEPAVDSQNLALVTKTEYLREHENSDLGPVVDHDSFELFAKGNQMLQNVMCSLPGFEEQDDIFTQSVFRSHREHEPDSDNEVDPLDSLLIPQASRPVPIDTAKDKLMESSEEDEGKKKQKEAEKKKRGRKKKTEIPAKQTNKSQQPSEKPVNEQLKILTRRMRERIRNENQAEKEDSGSDSEILYALPSDANQNQNSSLEDDESLYALPPDSTPNQNSSVEDDEIRYALPAETSKNNKDISTEISNDVNAKSDKYNAETKKRGLRSQGLSETSSEAKIQITNGEESIHGLNVSTEILNSHHSEKASPKGPSFSGFPTEDEHTDLYKKYIDIMNKMLPENETSTDNDHFLAPMMDATEPAEQIVCQPSIEFDMDEDIIKAKKSKKTRVIRDEENPPENSSNAEEKAICNPPPLEEIQPKPNCIMRHEWDCYPVDSNDQKLYQSCKIVLEKLPETFVQTYFEFIKLQNATKTKEDEEIERLANLRTLNRASQKEGAKVVTRRDSKQDGTKVDRPAVQSAGSVGEAEGFAELEPSDDEVDRDDGPPDFSPEKPPDTINDLAKTSLMDSDKSDQEDDENDPEEAKLTAKAKSSPKKTNDNTIDPEIKVKEEVEDETATPVPVNKDMTNKDLVLTIEKTMKKEMELLHAPFDAQTASNVEDVKPEKPKGRSRKGGGHKQKEAESSDEEEKKWNDTKQRLLQKMEQKLKESNNADDAKRIKLVNEYIKRKDADLIEHKKHGKKTKRMSKKKLEKQKQLKVLSMQILTDMFGEQAKELFRDTPMLSQLPGFKKYTANHSKGRRNIRKVLDKKSLAKRTVLANVEEFERKKRLNQQLVKMRELLGLDEGVNVIIVNDELCLEYSCERMQPVVSVHPYFTKVMKAHQCEGVKFMWDACFESVEKVLSGSAGGGCILAHCMGLGKTLQVLALLNTCLTHPQVGTRRVLVCCPLSTVLNWVDEIHKWCSPVNTNIKVFELSKLKKTYERAFQLEDWYNQGGIFIIGYELFRSLTTLDQEIDNVKPAILDKIRRALLDPGPDIVICDEGHLLKNDCSVLAIAMSRVKTKRRIILTGTPMQNNLREYYCMVNFVKPDLLGTYSEFSNRFENPIMNGQHRDSSEDDIKHMKARSHILHKVLEGCLQRQEASVLYPYLPKKYEYTVFISLTRCQAELYRHYLDRVARRDARPSVLRDFHVLQKIWTHPQVLHNFQKKARDAAASVAAGADPAKQIKEELGEDDLRTEELASEDVKPAEDLWWLQHLADEQALDTLHSSNKFAVVFQLIDECTRLGDKILVFSTSLFSMDTVEYFLKRELRWSLGADYYRLDGSVPAEVRQKWCREFNADNNTSTKLFLISTRAGCLGLNMTAANRVIILDTSWNPAHDIQSIFRVYRFGQKKDCYIYRLVSMGTMEQKIYERSVTKQAVACRVVDEQQIDRHYNMEELTELYRFDDSGCSVAPGIALGVRDVQLLRVARALPAVHAVHEHDSLLRDSAEQQLPEHERNAAWDQFQREQRSTEMPQGVKRKKKGAVPTFEDVEKNIKDKVLNLPPVPPLTDAEAAPAGVARPRRSTQRSHLLSEIIKQETLTDANDSQDSTENYPLSQMNKAPMAVIPNASGDGDYVPPGATRSRRRTKQTWFPPDAPKSESLTDANDSRDSTESQPLSQLNRSQNGSNSNLSDADSGSFGATRTRRRAKQSMVQESLNQTPMTNKDTVRKEEVRPSTRNQQHTIASTSNLGSSTPDEDLEPLGVRTRRTPRRSEPTPKKDANDQPIRTENQPLTQLNKVAIPLTPQLEITTSSQPQPSTSKVIPNITITSSSKPKPVTVISSDEEEPAPEKEKMVLNKDGKVPLHPALLKNPYFIKILSHSYKKDDPSLTDDVVLKTAEFNANALFSYLQKKNENVYGGPIYDIAHKLLGPQTMRALWDNYAILDQKTKNQTAPAKVPAPNVPGPSKSRRKQTLTPAAEEPIVKAAEERIATAVEERIANAAKERIAHPAKYTSSLNKTKLTIKRNVIVKAEETPIRPMISVKTEESLKAPSTPRAEKQTQQSRVVPIGLSNWIRNLNSSAEESILPDDDTPQLAPPAAPESEPKNNIQLSAPQLSGRGKPFKIRKIESLSQPNIAPKPQTPAKRGRPSSKNTKVDVPKATHKPGEMVYPQTIDLDDDDDVPLGQMSNAISGPVPISGPILGAGPMPTSGPFLGSGPVPMSGPIRGSGPVPVSGPIQGSGSITGPVPISGPILGSGPVPISGPILGSGPVPVSGPIQAYNFPGASMQNFANITRPPHPILLSGPGGSAPVNLMNMTPNIGNAINTTISLDSDEEGEVITSEQKQKPGPKSKKRLQKAESKSLASTSAVVPQHVIANPPSIVIDSGVLVPNQSQPFIPSQGQIFNPHSLNLQGLILNAQGQLVNAQGQRVNPQGQLINEKGQLIDAQGRLVNASGQLINENNHLINEQGQLINEEGQLVNTLGQVLTRVDPQQVPMNSNALNAWAQHPQIRDLLGKGGNLIVLPANALSQLIPNTQNTTNSSNTVTNTTAAPNATGHTAQAGDRVKIPANPPKRGKAKQKTSTQSAANKTHSEPVILNSLLDDDDNIQDPEISTGNSELTENNKSKKPGKRPVVRSSSTSSSRSNSPDADPLAVLKNVIQISADDYVDADHNNSSTAKPAKSPSPEPPAKSKKKLEAVKNVAKNTDVKLKPAESKPTTSKPANKPTRRDSEELPTIIIDEPSLRPKLVQPTTSKKSEPYKPPIAKKSTTQVSLPPKNKKLIDLFNKHKATPQTSKVATNTRKAGKTGSEKLLGTVDLTDEPKTQKVVMKGSTKTTGSAKYIILGDKKPSTAPKAASSGPLKILSVKTVSSSGVAAKRKNDAPVAAPAKKTKPTCPKTLEEFSIDDDFLNDIIELE